MSEEQLPCAFRWREWFSGVNSPAVANGMCRGCPILNRCLEQAMRMERREPASMRDGVWGGTTPKQRHLIATKGIGHPRAHELRHMALGLDPEDCAQCSAPPLRAAA